MRYVASRVVFVFALLVTLALVVSFSLFPRIVHAATVVSFTSVGTTTWTVPSGVTSVTYLVVGGGGGGGYNRAGGGGGGGMLTGTRAVTPGTSYTVVVGGGGSGGASNAVSGSNGGDSKFDTVISSGGGGGSSVSASAGNGGSGGGNAGDNTGAAGTGIAGQGNNGGSGGGGTGSRGGGGGGGAGAVGANGTTSAGGNGGAGTASSISGSSVTYAGGGGGAVLTSGTNGTGGAGGGGNGQNTTTGSAGTANTGGGGGAGGSDCCVIYGGGAGGSGIVVISYEPPRLTINDNVTINGDANITGALSKGSGTFVIDHPLDPKNKLLYHSFVESPDAMNKYVGRAVLDDAGSVAITLPTYFLALNKDFRYFATPVGVAMPDLHLSVKVKRRFFGLFGTPVFSIAGGVPGGEVSWMISGVRQDPYILKNPIVPEVGKGPGTPYSQGMYVHPDLYTPSTPQQ